MAFAGGCGARIRLAAVPCHDSVDSQGAEFDTVSLFSESPSRFIAEVAPNQQAAFETRLRGANVPFGHIGEVTNDGAVKVAAATAQKTASWLIDLPIAEVKEAWQRPLRW
jgi:phosphoribosylformylglycinamidine synthase